MDQAQDITGRWPSRFDDRMLKQIDFCRHYAANFGHGAPGHLDMLVISRLADCLQDAVAMIESVERTLHTDPAAVRELLAAYAHDAWSGWMKYMWERCDDIDGEGTIRIPNWAVARWDRQMNTSYTDLPEQEKASDRAEADKMLVIMREAVRAAR